MICKEIIKYLEEISPLKYAMEWDNIGLLVGREERAVNKILLALDATVEVVEKAKDYDMLITHHPMIFSRINRINSSNILGNKILDLIEHNVSYYAMHTNFDVCGGMADAVAKKLGFNYDEPLEDTIDGKGVGVVGSFKDKLNNLEICNLIKNNIGLKNVILYGAKCDVPCKIAISPGSGKSVISYAKAKGVTCLVTGDIGHHDALDAMEMGISIIDATHFGLEKIFSEYICDLLVKQFPNIVVNAYNIESPMEII